MTPRELAMEIDTFAEQFSQEQKRSLERDAWKLHWVLAGLVKDPPTIDQILGRADESPGMSVDEFQKMLHDINTHGDRWVKATPISAEGSA